MKHTGMVLLTLLVAAAAVVLLRPSDATPAAAASSSSRFVTSVLSHVGKPVVVPTPTFTRAMYTSVDLAQSTAAIDECRGPVAIELGADRPVLVAQHDYCGGSAWIPRLELNQAVRLTGDMVNPGTYVVTEIRFLLRGKGMVSDLPATDTVLQTCISKTKMILVGLQMVEPALNR